MKKLFLSMLTLAALSMSLVSCTTTTSVTYYPDWYYNCYPVYDYWGYYLYDDCYWEYYNEGSLVSQELDISASVADAETLELNKMAAHYGEKFGLSVEDATKIAKNVKDFTALEERSAEDLADFSQKMYGLNPSDVVSAVGKAQVGQNSELEALIQAKANDFKISVEDAKGLLQELHGSALEANGINL